jgi:uncharacterized protein (DUF58 family)
VGRSGPPAGRPTPLTLSAALATPSSLAVVVRQPVPVVAGGEAPTVALAPGAADGEAAVDVRWAVAGRDALPAPCATLADRAGLFVDRGPLPAATARVVVDPAPVAAVVDDGRRRAVAGYAASSAPGRPGTEVGNLRAYAPGDALARVDWKATARLNRLHVRDPVGDARPATTMLLDARARLRDGPPGRTKIEHLRTVALAVADRARKDGDPLGLVVVDDDGATTLPPATGVAHWRAIRRRLYEVGPSPPGGWRPPADVRSPASAATALARLADDDSPYAARLRPFFGDGGHARRLEADPLYAAAREVSRAGPGVAVLLTDDADRGPVRECVRALRRGGAAVTVALAPASAFDPAADAARRDSFASFRRELARIPGVNALAVGPLAGVGDAGAATVPTPAPASGGSA